MNGSIGRDFSSTVFQMAMKASRQQKDCTALLQLLSCRPEIRYSDQYSCEARIVDGSMLWRDQTVTAYYQSSKNPWPRYHKRHVFACPHQIFSSRKNFVNLKNGRGAKNKDIWPELKSCNYCHTEFRIDFQQLAEGLIMMFVTRWKDFGQDPSPHDEKWTRHTDFKLNPPKKWFNRGSIFTAFEQKQGRGRRELGFDFASCLEPRNKTIMLKSAKFKQELQAEGK